MKILLANSYFLYLDPKQIKFGQPYPPLATLLAAACLRKAGHEVRVFDTTFEYNNSSVEKVIQEYQPDFFVIYDDGFNYLTKMCLSNMREASFGMIAFAKKLNIPVAVSSSDATDHALEYLQKGADYIIKGEGEITLLELTEYINGAKNEINTINGLTLLKEGKTESTSPRAVLHELDTLPLPAWDLISIEKYKNIWLKKHGYFSLNVATTRGCPYKCNWCAKPIYGNRYNAHSPQRIVTEIQNLLQLGATHIWFCDDIFGLKPGWTHLFANLVTEKNLQFRYKIQSRVDLLLQETNINDLARSGCDTIWVGAESGSQFILDAMDKGTTLLQIEDATRLLQKKGIKVAFFLQFGYLGETWDDIVKTEEMVMRLMPDDIGISVSYPLPGTVFYENVKKELKDKTNWTDSADLEMMFKNTYSSDFYRQLHKYFHKKFRQKHSEKSIKSLLRGNVSSVNIVNAGMWPYYRILQSVEHKKLQTIRAKQDGGIR